MPKELPNPYEDILEPEEIRIGRPFAWLAIVLFLVVCVAPPLWRHWVESRRPPAERWLPAAEFFQWQAPPGDGVVAHLRAFEDRLEDSPFTEPPRQLVQGALLAAFREGNTKTIVAPDRRLYLRPAVEAITGTGPLEPAALGAASDPSLKRMRPALPAILRFADDLRARGVELVLVPVPVKAMIEPDSLVGASPPVERPFLHPDQADFYEAIRSGGVDVIDLAPVLFAQRANGRVFLDQDTHWRPQAMRAAAAAVADRLRTKAWFSELNADPSQFSTASTARAHLGDLVDNLDLPPESHGYQPEAATLEPVSDSTTGRRPESDPASPLVLLGDSFVNIFDDPSIGFGTEGEARIGAGFAQHLAAALGTRLDVIAVNGQAATGVRRTLARRYDDAIRAKKAVVWVIAARDLLYTPKLAAANQVVWEDVTWNSQTTPGEATTHAPEGELQIPDEGVIVEATLEKAAPIPDPQATPYTQSLYETVWIDVAGAEGGARMDRLPLQTWAFRDRRIVGSGRLETGRRYRFRVVPADTVEELEGQQVQTLDDELFLEFFFADSFEPVEAIR